MVRFLIIDKRKIQLLPVLVDISDENTDMKQVPCWKCGNPYNLNTRRRTCIVKCKHEFCFECVKNKDHFKNGCAQCALLNLDANLVTPNVALDPEQREENEHKAIKRQKLDPAVNIPENKCDDIPEILISKQAVAEEEVVKQEAIQCQTNDVGALKSVVQKISTDGRNIQKPEMDQDKCQQNKTEGEILKRKDKMMLKGNETSIEAKHLKSLNGKSSTDGLETLAVNLNETQAKDTMLKETTPKSKIAEAVSEKGSLCCAYCPSKFQTRRLLNEHYNLAHGNFRSVMHPIVQKNSSFQEPNSNPDFTNNSEASSKRNVHRRGVNYEQKQNLKICAVKNPPKEISNRCPMCVQTFGRKCSLENHLQRLHGVRTMFLPEETPIDSVEYCPECQNIFDATNCTKMAYIFCGHVSCAKCIIKAELGCGQCVTELAENPLEEEDSEISLKSTKAARFQKPGKNKESGLAGKKTQARLTTPKKYALSKKKSVGKLVFKPKVRKVKVFRCSGCKEYTSTVLKGTGPFKCRNCKDRCKI